MTDIPISERNTSSKLEKATLPDPTFEDEFFGYSPEEDYDGEGTRLVDRAVYRAKREGISLGKWIDIHRLYYKMRHDKKDSNLIK